MTMLPAGPGDVLAVPAGGVAGTLVKWGQLLAGKPSPAQHVVGITHLDARGRWIGIQGEPGGVNLVDCTPHLSDPRTRTNHGQPRASDHGQMATFLAAAAKSLGLAYDWAGIAADSAEALHAPDLAALIERFWQWPTDENLLPGHVVCSSLFAMLYDEPSIGWAHPDLGTERMCEPADWYRFNDRQLWH